MKGCYRLDKNGNVVNIIDTNLHYIEPHIMFIGKHKFLFFNYNTDIYYESLNTKIEMKILNKI